MNKYEAIIKPDDGVNYRSFMNGEVDDKIFNLFDAGFSVYQIACYVLDIYTGEALELNPYMSEVGNRLKELDMMRRL